MSGVRGVSLDLGSRRRHFVAAEQSQQGVMVALLPPPEITEALAQPDGVDDPHITLAYLGKVGEIIDRDGLLIAVRWWADHTAPMVGTISGWGAFSNWPDDEFCLVALWDIPALTAHRQTLVQTIESMSDERVNRKHGFTQHQTVKYVDEPVRVLPKLPEDLPEARFSEVLLAFGDEHYVFPLRHTL